MLLIVLHLAIVNYLLMDTNVCIKVYFSYVHPYLEYLFSACKWQVFLVNVFD